MKKLTLLIILSSVIMLYAQPVCTVEITDDKYRITVNSEDSRTPMVVSTVDIPERTPIIHDSFYNACIIKWNSPQDSVPVANTLVSIWGYPDAEWGVDVNTSFAGCFNVKIPADSNFTMKAMNPDTKEFAKLGGTILSAGVGQLLSSGRDKVMPFDGDLMHIASIQFEEGVTSHEVKEGIAFALTSDMKVTKHSAVISFPTKVGKKYVVTIYVDKPVWIWFSDNSRHVNPAKIITDSEMNIDVPLHALTATKTSTRLYFQPQNTEKLTVKSITIKEVN